ncbi:MAG: hypothetical protein IPM66_21075 [Acidobacteriota bacterium]|nr:MAG: hypothetical protein IPM66_21075 [Acidobacteriota bacterium]
MDCLRGWHDYFVSNANRVPEVDWEDGYRLTDEERRLIGRSIAAFQVGEYSEGRGLLRSAEEFARRADGEYLVRITKLFILEEQRHAGLLLEFMRRHGIAPIKKHWTDRVFRRLRRDVGFELSVTVLITAEIISLVYYRALWACTGSNQLKSICGRLLSDERAHVEYESGLLREIRDGKPLIYRGLIRIVHGTLLAGAMLAVWVGHRGVLEAGGFGFWDFWNATWHEYSQYFGPGDRAMTMIGGSGEGRDATRGPAS